MAALTAGSAMDFLEVRLAGAGARSGASCLAEDGDAGEIAADFVVQITREPGAQLGELALPAEPRRQEQAARERDARQRAAAGQPPCALPRERDGGELALLELRQRGVELAALLPFTEPLRQLEDPALAREAIVQQAFRPAHRPPAKLARR